MITDLSCDITSSLCQWNIRLEQFDSPGDGVAPVVNDTNMIELPEDLCSVIDNNDKKKILKGFCCEIFPNLHCNIGDET